jgi:hypothetical protein
MNVNKNRINKKITNVKLASPNKIVMVVMINATFNNISVISWRSVLLVKETGENHRPATSHGQTLSHNVRDDEPTT